MSMSSWKEKVIKIAEDLGFTAKYEEGKNTVTYWIFSQYSPRDQDFNIEVDADDIEELATELRERYENYDCSAEAYIWLDDFGHGQNGAPYDMKDVYEDMKWCENKIDELATKVEQLRGELEYV